MKHALDSAAELNVLLKLIDESYSRRSWHGPNLRGSLRGVSAKLALWRPGQGRKNIAEIALHAAYWKYVAWRRLVGEKRGSFPLAGSNWFERSAPYSEAQWKKDLALLEKMHATLRAAVAAISPEELTYRLNARSVTNAALIRGIALHDVYHAGQIQTLKRLARASG
ncbi:MAG: DinB family protein [Planctomycetia bacterium]|nr:DinB family protein [Planctomycetia bacterium]